MLAFCVSRGRAASVPGAVFGGAGTESMCGGLAMGKGEAMVPPAGALSPARSRSRAEPRSGVPRPAPENAKITMSPAAKKRAHRPTSARLVMGSMVTGVAPECTSARMRVLSWSPTPGTDPS